MPRNNKKRNKNKTQSETQNKTLSIKVSSCSDCPLRKYVGGPDICSITRMDTMGGKAFKKCPLREVTVSVGLAWRPHAREPE